MTASYAFEQQANILWRGMDGVPSSRPVAGEAAIALTYGGSTYAVMMATPADLEEFAIGFSMTEGIVERADEIESIEIIQADLGIEVRMWLAGRRAQSFIARRRAMVGPVGCGLCGVESLEQAQRAPRRVDGLTKFRAGELLDAMRALAPQQGLNRMTRAVHAAGFWRPSSAIAVLREDVGRHNALDKLAGALLVRDELASDGVILLTSRVSVEMVQKTAMIGAPVMMAVSAPTTLAIRMADAAGITLVAIARDDGYEVFTHPDRILFPKGGGGDDAPMQMRNARSIAEASYGPDL